MATFVILPHPVTISVTDFIHPYNLTIDLLIPTLDYYIQNIFFMHKKEKFKSASGVKQHVGVNQHLRAATTC